MIYVIFVAEGNGFVWDLYDRTLQVVVFFFNRDTGNLYRKTAYFAERAKPPLLSDRVIERSCNIQIYIN
jgi:hypothetical protein